MPSSVSERPRVHCSVRDHHRTGLHTARKPHKMTARLSASHPGLRGSNKMWPLKPSHTTSPPSSTKIISMVIRSTCCGVSILLRDLYVPPAEAIYIELARLLHALDFHLVQSNPPTPAGAAVPRSLRKCV